LFSCGRPTEHAPRLSIAEDHAFATRAGAEHVTVLVKRTHEPLSVPAPGLQRCIQPLELRLRPMHFLLPFESRADVDVRLQAVAQLKRNEHALSAFTQTQTIIPVGFESTGEAVRSTAFDVELQCAP